MSASIVAFTEDGVRFERAWCMPNKWTFKMPPVARLIARHHTISHRYWFDPFAGMASPALLKNDLNPEIDAHTHLDALEFVSTVVPTFARAELGQDWDAAFFDPPYTPRQVAEAYKGVGRQVSQETTRSTFWSNVKDAMRDKVRIGGKVISCGFNTQGMGKKRGYKPIEYLFLAHGGAHADTCVVVEERVDPDAFPTPEQDLFVTVEERVS